MIPQPRAISVLSFYFFFIFLNSGHIFTLWERFMEFIDYGLSLLQVGRTETCFVCFLWYNGYNAMNCMKRGEKMQV